MKRILICGATGFIGRNLLEYYLDKNEYNIRATYFRRSQISNINVEWIYADLRNYEDVKKALKDVDIVLQFAATTSGSKDIVNQPYLHVTDNAIMNSLILRECYEQKIEHLIFPSCTVMYQKSETAISESDFNESEEILPFYYGVGNTKVYVEKMCNFYSRLGRTKHTVIRHSNIYGPHDKFDLEKSHVFGATVTKVMTSANGIISVWGTGEESRDLLHVNDLINFIDISIKKQVSNFEIYNVGYGEGIKVIDLVKKVIKHSGKNIEIEHDLSKPSVPTSLFLDCSKAKNELGWTNKISLDEGVINTLDWYNKNYL
jgi:nucleoside-diphosphate-sugar epimerase